MDYSKMLSKTAVELKPSGIRKFFDMLEGRRDVISLTVGQPDFPTPWHVREAGIISLEKGYTYYTSNSGTLQLRQEISKYLSRRFDMNYDPNSEIIVTVGGSEAIDLAIRAIVEAGDEVIIPEPCFVCYDPLVRMAGGAVVPVATRAEDEFMLTAEQIRQRLTNRTKMVILPFPNNPTGAVMSREELEKIAKLLDGTNIAVLSDEIYAELTYGKKHVSPASIDGMRERTVIASGFSKAYSMTGWRLGYTVAPAEIAKQMLKIHQFAVMCASTTSQLAAISALQNGDDDIETMKGEYDRRRRFIVKGLCEAGLPCLEPQGAFYVFPYVGGYGMSSEEFCNRLLNEKGVAIVPGTAFGDCGEGYARISYAYSVKHISKALERIAEFTESLRSNRS